MDTYQETSFVLILIAMTAIMYKIYQQSKLDNPKRKGSLTILFNRIYSPRYFLPVSERDYDYTDIETIKKANQALKIFWWTFFIAIGVALIGQFFKHK